MTYIDIIIPWRNSCEGMDVILMKVSKCQSKGTITALYIACRFHTITQAVYKLVNAKPHHCYTSFKGNALVGTGAVNWT